MKSKLSVFMAVFIVVCTVVGLSYTVVLRNRFTSKGIEQIETVDDLKNLDIHTNLIMTSAEAKFVSADTTLEEGTSVLVVEPTGKFHQYRGSFSQEVEVISVQDGECDVEPGELIQIYRAFGIRYRDDGVINDEIIYPLYVNIMYPENRYLVFVGESELNVYLTQKEFYVNKSYPSVINIDLEEPKPASSDFNQCEGLDIFCATQEVADEVYEVERQILKKYGI